MKLALFDIDGTLVTGAHTEPRFARYLWQARRIGWRQAWHFAAFTVAYLPRYGSGVWRKNKAYLAGLPTAEVCELASRFADEVIAGSLSAVTCERLQHHQRQGDAVWLLSGTLEAIALATARLLDVQHVIAARAPAVNGIFAGKPPSRHPYGKTKLSLAKSLCASLGVGLEDVVAYADSWSDRFLLQQVGTAVAVEPDRKLAALARCCGWEVLGAGE